MARRRVELGPRPPPCVHRGYGRCRRGDRRAERGMTPATTPRPTPNSAAGVTPGRSTCPGLRPSEETFPSHTSGATSRRAELGVDPKDVRQLRQVTYPGGQTEAFTYGAAGNRLSRRAGGTTTSAPTTTPASRSATAPTPTGRLCGRPLGRGRQVKGCPGTTARPGGLCILRRTPTREPSVPNRCAVTQDVSSAAVRTTRATGVRPRPRLTRPHRLVRPAAALARSR